MAQKDGLMKIASNNEQGFALIDSFNFNPEVHEEYVEPGAAERPLTKAQQKAAEKAAEEAAKKAAAGK